MLSANISSPGFKALTSLDFSSRREVRGVSAPSYGPLHLGELLTRLSCKHGNRHVVSGLGPRQSLRNGGGVDHQSSVNIALNMAVVRDHFPRLPLSEGLDDEQATRETGAVT